MVLRADGLDRGEDLVAQVARVIDADEAQLGVRRLTARGVEVDGARVQHALDRALDDADVLDAVERGGVLAPRQDAGADQQVLRRDPVAREDAAQPAG